MMSTSSLDWNVTDMMNNTYILPLKASLLPDMLYHMRSMHVRRRNAIPLYLVEQAHGPIRLGAGPGDQPLAYVFWGRSCRSGDMVAHREHYPSVLRRMSMRRTRLPEIGSRTIPCEKHIQVPRVCIQMSRALLFLYELRRSRSSNCSTSSCVKIARHR
jgi:hypothetical protein